MNILGAPKYTVNSVHVLAVACIELDELSE
jgi:hypothetical protein